jgi:hypothetical protein
MARETVQTPRIRREAPPKSIPPVAWAISDRVISQWLVGSGVAIDHQIWLPAGSLTSL